MPVRGDWPLVGRDGELRSVEEAASAAVPGMLLVGDAGIGKTRLLREVVARLVAGGMAGEWVAATAAARSIPFGAVSHLLPASLSQGRNPVALFAAVERQFRTRGAGRPVVVGVDDAHLLDEASAGLLHQLAVRGVATVLATVRAGEPVSDALAALWREGGQRLQVSPLPDVVVDDLIDRAVPGPLDAISRRRLSRLADGNPLLLRELLNDAIETGALRERRGIWRWHGTGSGSPRLAELVTARLRALDPAIRTVLEIIACGEVVSLSLLQSIADPAALEAAERSGLAVAERSGARVALRLMHPLYGEALRSSMPASRARTVFGQLGDAVARGPMRRSDDALVAGFWHLQSGNTRHPRIMLAAARQAIERFDIDLAERLARAAHGAGQNWEAAWLLARVLQFQARNREAFEVLPEAPPPGTKRLAMWAITRAGLLYWGFGRSDAAYETLDLVPAGSPGHDLAAAFRSWILFYDGRCRAALQAARGVLEGREVSVRATAWATMSATAAAGMLGQPALAVSLVEGAQPMVAGRGGTAAWGDAQVGWGRCYALRAAGQLHEAAEEAERGYRAAVASEARGMAGVWAGFLGVIAKSQGRLSAADASLREAIALLEENDQYQLVRMFQAELAGVRALAGDADEAGKWLAAADAGGQGANRLFDPWVELDRAWVEAAAQDLTAAARTARRAAGLARDTEQPTLEAVALYDCARLGSASAVLERLRALAREIDGGNVTTLLAAAEGLARDDGAALERAADEFQHSGHLLLAAEAATAAGHAYRSRGQEQRRRAAGVRAATLAAGCPEARTPLLAGVGAGDYRTLLTRRERDVAQLAGSMASREIARRLGLSVNTVNNNLARVFAKLGVRNRGELAALLGDAASRP